MNAEERALARYEAWIYAGAPEDEPRVQFTAKDLRKSFTGCGMLQHEYLLDLWAEVRKPLERLLDLLSKPRITP